MKLGKRFVGMGALLALASGACSGVDGQTAETSAQAPETQVEGNESINTTAARVAKIDATLQEGSRGEHVRALHDYLTEHGYFPNADLAELYPAWRPLVAEAPRDLDAFDAKTTEAVMQLQRHAGVLETGIVDAATLGVMKMHRCGVPDGIEATDEADKYALQGSKWASNSVTWKVTNNDDVTLTQARTAAAGAFASWAAQSGMTFTEVTGAGSADILITFGAIDGASNILAQAFYPQFGGDVTVDTAETWSVATPTPAGQFDLQTILLHELGHSLGLNHSSISGATLFPFASSGSQDRTLATDDNVGISALYDTFELLPGCAKDLGVGANGVVWAIGCAAGADGTLFKWNGSNWTVDAANGAAARVDVSPGGIPWAVVSDGSIWRRSSSDAASGSWEQLPGCAKDIGVGSDGSVWAIGCADGPDGTLFKWNGSNWTVDAASGAAARVTVGPAGEPWAVVSNNSIWRRSSGNPASGSWSQLPGAGNDIGLSDGNYAWLIGTDPQFGSFGIYTWDEQAALGSNAPARAEWVNKPGGASVVDVGPNGRPWVITSGGSIYRGSP
jgi:peptidoglycan hydrolase-like protein with peptidoglycan-binding domain